MSFTDFRKKISLDVELCLTRMNICLEIYKFYCSEVFDRLLDFSLHLNCLYDEMMICTFLQWNLNIHRWILGLY